uniref:Putative reverse transcriptase-rnase h-integrase n=1 Tax=Moniliophthora roreri TaxID=221103 RepID=A0A0W0F1F5_MONRR
MSNATAAASSSSASSSQPARVPSPVPTVSEEGRYRENITYLNGLKPNPYQLLHLFNSGQYDNQIRAAADQHNRLEPCIKSLFFLRTQRKLSERIVESCSLKIANQVMYTCNYQLGLAGPIMVLSTFPYHPHLSMPPPADPRAMSEYPDPLSFSLLDRLGQRTDGNGYPCPNINDTQSLVSRLTSEPLVDEMRLSTIANSTPDPVDTLIYPDPTPDPDVKPKIEPTNPTDSPQPRSLTTVEHIPTVGGEVILEGSEDEVEVEEQENQTLENDNIPPMLSLRSPTPAPTPMMKLVDHVSALCADWSAISPDIAHSTCAVDASKLNLDIHLATALTSEGLAELHVEGLVRVQTLCRMITVMTMNLTKILEENAEKSIHDSRGNVDFLFIGTDLRKVQRFEVGSSVYGRMAAGWQPDGDRSDIPTPQSVDETAETVEEMLNTPMLRSIDEMPDMLYDYNAELYGDGES